MLKTNATELIDESADVLFTLFRLCGRHRPLEEYLVFVGIRDAHTSFSPFTSVVGASDRSLWRSLTLKFNIFIIQCREK